MRIRRAQIVAARPRHLAQLLLFRQRAQQKRDRQPTPAAPAASPYRHVSFAVVGRLDIVDCYDECRQICESWGKRPTWVVVVGTIDVAEEGVTGAEDELVGGFQLEWIVDSAQNAQVGAFLQLQHAPRKRLDLVVVAVEGWHVALCVVCVVCEVSEHDTKTPPRERACVPMSWVMPDIPLGRCRSRLQSTRSSSSRVKPQTASGSSSSLLFSRNSRLSPVRRLITPAGTDDSSLWLRLRLRRLASELDGTDAGGGSICAILL